MNLNKTGNIAFVLKVLEKLKGKWIAAISSSLILAFLVAALSNLIQLSPMVGLPIIGFVLLGEITFMRRLLNNEAYKLEDLFEHYKLFIPAFLTAAILFMLLGVGFLLLIVPGVLVLVNYSFALHILEEHKTIGALEAFNKSQELSKGHRIKIGLFYLMFLLLTIVLFGVCLAVMLIPNLIWGIPFVLYAGVFAGVLELVFVAPLFYASITQFYDDLKSGAFDKQQEPVEEFDEVEVVEEVKVIETNDEQQEQE